MKSWEEKNNKTLSSGMIGRFLAEKFAEPIFWGLKNKANFWPQFFLLFAWIGHSELSSWHLTRWSCFYLCILVFPKIPMHKQMVHSCLEILPHQLAQHPFPLHLDPNGQLIDTEQSSWKMIFHLSPELNMGDIALGHMQLQLVYKLLLLITWPVFAIVITES